MGYVASRSVVSNDDAVFERSPSIVVSDGKPVEAEREQRGDLVALYAARAAATGIDVRRVVGPDRAGVVSRGHQRAHVSLILREPIPIGRGTVAHREAVQRSAGLRGLFRRQHPFSVRQTAPSRAPLVSGSGVRRRLAAASLALVVIVAAAGSALAQPRTGLQANLRPGFVAAPAGALRTAALDARSLDVLSARVAAGNLALPTGAATSYEVVRGDTLARIASTYGVSVRAIAEANALPDPDLINAGQQLLIPAAEGTGGDLSSATSVATGQAWIPSVGTYVQQRNLSCEYAASFIATSAFGAGVEEWVFWEQVPAARNPHYGYRGNIDGWWGNTDDYGVYAEALEPVLNANGFGTETFYSFGDPAALKAQLDLGRPVVVWLGLWGDTSEIHWDDGRYTLAAGAHVVTVYGYDSWGVHVSDPATGTYRSWSWDDFTWMWSVLDGMSLAIYPY
ncbi:MAG TPA: LysM peptidoglycan-binding domain-containing protein [Thermomicrobiales bacterium]|nr:LysM peptidoglycan-binding domain-containing protein [Thermomicrobiales bacterium]